jgi:hypothetical protein
MPEIIELELATGVVVASPTVTPTGTTSAKSADYTVTDTDNIRTIFMTTGGTNRIVTLPTAADNAGRILTVKKVDNGVGYCGVDGEGAETVDGMSALYLYGVGDCVTVTCNGTSWETMEGRPEAAFVFAASFPFTMLADGRKTQVFNPGADSVVTLPTTGVKSGDMLTVVNRASGFKLTVNASGGSATLSNLFTGYGVFVALQDAPTTPAHWLVVDYLSEGSFTVNTITWSASVAPSSTLSQNHKFSIRNGWCSIRTMLGYAVAGTATTRVSYIIDAAYSFLGPAAPVQSWLGVSGVGGMSTSTGNQPTQGVSFILSTTIFIDSASINATLASGHLHYRLAS